MHNTIAAPICMGCTHFHAYIYTHMECDAYKNIPDAILTSEADHRQPYPGDNGIQFSKGEPQQRQPEEPLAT